VWWTSSGSSSHLPYAQEVGSGRAAYILRDTVDRLERATVKPHLRDAGRRLRAVLPPVILPERPDTG